MKTAFACSIIGLFAFGAVPAQAALLVNWSTGEYTEVGWEVCYVAALNNSEYQCFGGLSAGDAPFDVELANEAVKNFRGTIPAEPIATQTKATLLGDHNSTRSNQSTLKLPEGEDATGSPPARANHNTTRSNQAAGKIPVGTGTGGADAVTQANINTSGSNTTGKTSDPMSMWDTAVSSDDALPINDKRKCIKSGGTWATNSTGSFCLRSLKR